MKNFRLYQYIKELFNGENKKILAHYNLSAFLDTLSTYFCVKSFGISIEANPSAKEFMKSYGIENGLVIKEFINFLLFLFLLKLHNKKQNYSKLNFKSILNFSTNLVVYEIPIVRYLAAANNFSYYMLRVNKDPSSNLLTWISCYSLFITLFSPLIFDVGKRLYRNYKEIVKKIKGTKELSLPTDISNVRKNYF